MLKEVPESFLKTLLGFFQRCWDGGTIPAEWKHAVVVPIHKIGKARKEIASYRPVSLTSHLGKVYERVIKRRLEYFCETKKVFPACQAGFRRGRGVTLSTQKTVFLPFHICSRRIQDISIKVNNEHVFPTDQVKYLGVVFQRMGRTNRHVDHNAHNASRALNVIKVLSSAHLRCLCRW